MSLREKQKIEDNIKRLQQICTEVDNEYEKLRRKEEIIFCPDNCEFLSITEKEQTETPLKPPHRCKALHGVRLLHNNRHPKIYRCENCLKIAQALADHIEAGYVKKEDIIVMLENYEPDLFKTMGIKSTPADPYRSETWHIKDHLRRLAGKLKEPRP